MMTYRHTYTWATLFLLLYLFAACTDERNETVDGTMLPDGTSFEVAFSGYADHTVNVPTRGDAEDLNALDNLRLLVFDENNRFLYSRKAVLENILPDNIGDEHHLPQKKKEKITHVYRFKVQLISSTKPRRVHFIAGYDWQGFPQDYFLEGKDAGQVVPGLSTTRKNAFWREIKFAQLQAAQFNNKVFKLLRNNARISLRFKKGGIRNFMYEGFKVYNAYDRGTVAPYIFKETDRTYLFPETPDTPTIPAGVQVPDAETQSFKKEFIDVFERFDRDGEARPLFLILKGKFQGNPAFYKIELKRFDEETGVSARYDVIRNYHYYVTVNEIHNKGYATEREAAVNVAGNNIFASTELEEFPSVSDGEHTLTVSPLGGVFVSQGVYESTVSFTGGIDKVRIYSAWDVQTDEYLGAATITKLNETTGKLTIPIKQAPTDRELKFKANIVARPNPRANGGIITREITLDLRKPYDFRAKLTSRSSSAQSEVRITFEVPATMASTAFPFDVLIRTKELTPDISSQAKNNHLILGFENGSFFYRYTVKSSDEVGKTITLNFKRNRNNASETITLSAPYYKEQRLTLP